MLVQSAPRRLCQQILKSCLPAIEDVNGMLEKQLRSLKLCGYRHSVKENASVDLNCGLWLLTENYRDFWFSYLST